jgi:hypothetical protein
LLLRLHKANTLVIVFLSFKVTKEALVASTRAFVDFLFISRRRRLLTLKQIVFLRGIEQLRKPCLLLLAYSEILQAERNSRIVEIATFLIE